jgi:hypothetical protein
MKNLLDYRSGRAVGFEETTGECLTAPSAGISPPSGLFSIVRVSPDLRHWRSSTVAAYVEKDLLVLQLGPDRWQLQSGNLDTSRVAMWLRQVVISASPATTLYFLSSMLSLRWDGTGYVDIDDWPTLPNSLFEWLGSYCRTGRVDWLVRVIQEGSLPIKWM